MVKNAKTLPQIYYGLHMCEGLAEYEEPNAEPYRILILENAIKQMDPTFAGKPVYVRHKEEVNLDNLQVEADGYVIESFFNMMDGKHWTKFIVVSDKGHEAIRAGWKLSNAYIPKSFGGGGKWHNVDYLKEVTSGEYEHLAIVPNPRYEESIVLTPDKFKDYNSKKDLELKRLANSKGESSMLKFFKKATVENSAELETMSVTLPKTKKEMVLNEIINAYDDMMKKNEEPQMANGDHHVMVGDEKMTVNELIEKHKALKDAMDGKDQADKDAHEKEKKGEGELSNDEDEAAKKKALELAEHEEKEIKEKKANEEEENKEKKMNDLKHFNELKDAPLKALEHPSVDLPHDQIERGRVRYGSN